MENNKCGCEDTECIDESVKDKPNETKEDKPNEDNGCECEDTEHVNKSSKGNSDVAKGEGNDCGCEEEYADESEDTGCGCSSGDIEYVEELPKGNLDEPEEDAGCGCGCGATEYVDIDESRIDNPDKPKVIATDDFIKEFENYAHSIGIKSIGYTQVTPELLIQDKFIQYPNTIVLTLEMDKEIIETAPGPEALELNNLAYEKLGNITYNLSDYLREKGFATEVAHPFGSLVKFSPLAQKSGLGWIGKNGLLITPELGPRLKISAIFVSIANLPVKDHDEHSWIPDYCDKCGKCVKACPENALIQRETCFGGKEIEFIQRLCIGCSKACTYCIEGCPFDKKGYEHVKNRFDKMNAKLMEKNKNKCC